MKQEEIKEQRARIKMTRFRNPSLSSLVFALGFLLFVEAGMVFATQAKGTDNIGRLDTVGGTTYDLQSKVWAYYDSGYGIHVAWTYSAMSGGGYPDRNVRYNFYDLGLLPPSWAFNLGPDFINWGVGCFQSRARFGNFDVSPYDHCAYLCATVASGGGLATTVARDQRPGAGSFTESPGPDGYMLPLLSVGHSGRTHVIMQQDVTLSGPYYSSVDTSLVWSTPPWYIPPPAPNPEYPVYWIAASKRNARVTALWTDWGRFPRQIYYRRSTDDGSTWLDPDSLPYPPAFHPGSDTLPVVIDLYPWYDPDEDEDGLHLGVSLVPVVGESTLMNPSEIWHWSDVGGWARVVRAGCRPEHLQGTMGGSTYAGQPSLGHDRARHQWVCAWEQFDSANVEPLTGELRADIWACRGDSLGQHWGSPIRLTDPDSTSKRFPCVANGVYADTCAILYLVDLVAGYAVNGVGPSTVNPMVVRWVPISAIPPPPTSGIAESPAAAAPAHASRLGASPDPTRGRVQLSYRLSGRGPVNLSIYDAAGKLIAQPLHEVQTDGVHQVSWDASSAAPGVYFATLQAGGQTLRRKLIVSR